MGATPGLVGARDACCGWLYAHRQGLPFCLDGPGQELEWLGLDWQPLPEPVRPVRLRDARFARDEEISLPELAEADTITLTDLKQRGIVAEAVLTTLVESSWRSPRGGSGLSRVELRLYFSLEGLKTGPVRFCEDSLWDAHLFFLEELTPKELLRRTVPELSTLSEEQRKELEGLALLFGEQVEDLNQFRAKLDFFFQPPESPPASSDLIEQLDQLHPWEVSTLSPLLERDEWRHQIAQSVLGRPESNLAEICALLGKGKILKHLAGFPAK